MSPKYDKYCKREEVLVNGKLVWYKRCRSGAHLYQEFMPGCSECAKASIKRINRTNYRAAKGIPIDAPILPNGTSAADREAFYAAFRMAKDLVPQK